MKSDAAAFPWDWAMRQALAGLGWTPDVFWRATPRELAAALGLRSGPLAPDRVIFERLAMRYPD